MTKCDCGSTDFTQYGDDGVTDIEEIQEYYQCDDCQNVYRIEYAPIEMVLTEETSYG